LFTVYQTVASLV